MKRSFVRRAVTALAVAATVGIGAATPVAGHRADGHATSTLSDPALLAAIDAAQQQRRAEGGPERRLTVELHTADATSATAAVVAAGGTVTGAVPGELVQARVPASRIHALTQARGVRYVKAPRRAGYVTPPDRPVRLTAGTGVVGAAVPITNAGSWQDAGFTGAGVKVGIIDFFDLARWATVAGEAGPVPDSAHRFCRDSVFAHGDPDSYCTALGGFNPSFGDVHGVAVAEVVKDMAPAAELFLATVATTADLQAAVDWFATKGVTIVTRSLGAAYDGPGDGTGPLAAVVDAAVAKGITWFNSAGNDGRDAYMKFTVPTSLGANGYVDFDEGPGVDTYLRIDGDCVLLDGVRWSNDWYLPAAQRTDYSLEFHEPTFDVTPYGDHYNPPSPAVEYISDASQTGGASPLEGEDLYFCPDNSFGAYGGISYLRIRRNASTPVGATADTIEIALAVGLLERDYADTAGSAAKAVVDSRSPGLVAVGAVDPPAGNVIGPYSSQGPTTDGRIKPDVSAPAGFASVAFSGTFSGTSAASPVAAGMAALLQGGGLVAPGVPTASMVKHLTLDLGAPGPDNAFGEGKVVLPAVPAPAAGPTASAFVPLSSPYRLLDSRPTENTPPPGLAGPFAPYSLIDVALDLPGDVLALDITAVAVNVTSVNSDRAGYLQVFPTLRGLAGGTSTLNLAYPGMIRANMAVLPVGDGNRISVYLHAGGDVVIDVMGVYTAAGAPTAAGRFVALDTPERWMDTRGELGAPLPTAYGGTPRRVSARETVSVPRLAGSAVAADAQALVVTVTSDASLGDGFLRAVPSGRSANTSTVNYTAVGASANAAIVPLSAATLGAVDAGQSGISVYSHNGSHVIVDVVGYITSAASPAATEGLFVPLAPHRTFDSRLPTPSPLATGEIRPFTMVAPSDPLVPAGAAAVSMNVTITEPGGPGFARAFPLTPALTSTVNYTTNQTVAAAAFTGLDATGRLRVYVHTSTHLILDVNGYFLP